MSQVQHIANHQKELEARAHIIRGIREFFWNKNFLEMETPLLLALPGQEPYLHPMQVKLHNEEGKEFTGYLHTSPEYALKKMLGAGFEKIFSVTKTFRDYESFGGTHNPEFTMIEWYRAHENFYALMDDCEELWKTLATSLSKPDLAKMPWERLHMRDAWERYADVELDDYLTAEAMRELAREKGYTVTDTTPYEDAFFHIFLNEIEPHLGKEGATIIHHYPAQMAALSRLSDGDSRYAERFEVYIGGMEIANAFGELTDPKEQQERLEKESEERKKAGKPTFSVDMEFIEALRTMPMSSGIALGIDRLIQVLLQKNNINDVLALPASFLFSTES